MRRAQQILVQPRAFVRRASYRASVSQQRPPANLGIAFVPQQQAWIIERFGKFNRILHPGLNFCIPVLEQISYVQSLKEITIDIPQQSAITLDNVTLHIDGVLYYKIFDPYKASYGIEHHSYAVVQLAQTTMRSELGKISLDNVFQERTALNHGIVEAINSASEAWGIHCMRYEIRDIQLPEKVKEAMQMQVEAERKKRAQVLTSEGERQAAINVAEGHKQSQILASEALKMEQINEAEGEAKAIMARADARARAIRAVAAAIEEQGGANAASLSVAEQYVDAFGNLAKTNNTVLLPSDTGNIASMVGQAMSIFGQMTKKGDGNQTDPSPRGGSGRGRGSSHGSDRGVGGGDGSGIEGSQSRHEFSVFTSPTRKLQDH
ncbi:stomatin-like protein stl-1 [Oscarella lobularis]|uniref:stomatin-like protein stl-1 n=1 Tax=Oscarella lobularis TaxID=121494 RepID=UPI003313ED80